MAIISPKTKAQVARTANGCPPVIRWFPEGTHTWTQANYGLGGTQAIDTRTSTGYIRAGALVAMNSTYGLDCPRMLMVATASDATRNRLVGILLADCNGTATHQVPVALADQNNIFIASVASRTSAATATVSRVTTYTAGGGTGFAAGASMTASAFYPATVFSSAGASFVRILDKYESDDWNDRYGRVYFQFLASRSLFPAV